eukprot:Lankesteria_metandrocarpae@DN1977_c0_g1_i1.p1
MVLQIADKEFTHILRVHNTNVEGKRCIWVALTAIRGIGRRFATLACKKADINPARRAGELSADEINRLTAVIAAPLQFQIPLYFVNRQRDVRDGKNKQLVSNQWDGMLREDFERLKKIRCNRGLRHAWGLKVRGQHTKTTGRRGKTVGVAKKR